MKKLFKNTLKLHTVNDKKAGASIPGGGGPGPPNILLIGPPNNRAAQHATESQMC